MDMIMLLDSQICRCCLAEQPTISYNIFERENLCKNLMECVPSLKISLNDGLPDLICDLCWLRLCEAVDFKRRCEEADQELRSKLKKSNDNNNENLENNLSFEYCSSSTVLEKTDFINEEAMLCNLSISPCELTAAEINMLNDLLLEDQNYSQNNNLEREEDPMLTDLFNMVLNDDREMEMEKETEMTKASVKSTTTTTEKSPENSNQSSIVSSTTSAKNVTKNSKNSTKKKKTEHTCTECSKKFTRNFQLKLHLSSVHNIGESLQYKCEECQKNFASLHSLNYHRKSLHTEFRAFACNKCERRFVLRSQLASHERIHTGQTKPRIFKCEKCEKVWPTKSDLRTHERTHEPKENVIRRFKCDQCEKRFLTRGHLTSHLLVHTGEKPFVCSLCSKSYQCVGNLNNHMVKRHSAFRTRYRHCDQATVIEM